MKRDGTSRAAQDALDALWLKLRGIEAVKNGNWRMSLDYIRTHLILIVTSGLVQVTADGHHFSLASGNAIVCLPGQLVKAACDMKSESELYVLHFDVKSDWDTHGQGDLPDVRQDFIFPLSGPVALSDNSWTILNCESAASLWQSGDSLQKMQAQTLFQGIFYQLLLDSLYGESDKDVESALNRTKLYMERHYDRNITIDELAEMAGLSRYYYMRSFKLAYGISAMDYLLELRIGHSKRLMEKTDIRLRDIAKQVGYNDEYYFNRKFKQKVGIPPVAYMKSRKQRVAAYSFPNIGQLLALRVVPYAAPMDHSWTDLYRRKYDSDVVVKLSHDYEFNLEALRQARPDYIIGVDHFVPVEEQRKIKQIAPTFFVPWSEQDWRGHLRLTADFLGNDTEAVTWLEEYECKAAKASELMRHVVGEDTILVLQVHNNKYYVYGERSIAGVLYQDLGLSPPTGAAAIASHEEVTLSRLSKLNADWIFLMITDSSSPHASWDKMRQSEVWASMKAVRNERVSLISPYLWFEYSAYTQEKFLDGLSGMFKA